MRLATGNAVELTAGSPIPPTTVGVVNGGGQQITRCQLAGQKQSLSIVQRLLRLEDCPGEADFLLHAACEWVGSD